jgi:hypothetical protein
MPFYKATKKGWDGRREIKPGEVFPFAGPKGSWMVECDREGNVKPGEKVPVAQRALKQGTTARTRSREDLRSECKAKGIPFKATMGAVDLAKLLTDHADGTPPGTPAEVPAPAPGEEGKGTGDQDVI